MKIAAVHSNIRTACQSPISQAGNMSPQISDLYDKLNVVFKSNLLVAAGFPLVVCQTSFQWAMGAPHTTHQSTHVDVELRLEDTLVQTNHQIHEGVSKGGRRPATLHSPERTDSIGRERHPCTTNPWQNLPWPSSDNSSAASGGNWHWTNV